MINKVKLGINNLYLFKNNNDDYLLLDTALPCKEDVILDEKSNRMSRVIVGVFEANLLASFAEIIANS